MKRCPQCYEAYEDGARFCETDGRELLADPVIYTESQAVTPAPSAAAPVWLPAAALGVLLGIGIGAGVFAVMTFSSGSSADEPQVVREAPSVREAVPPSSRPMVAEAAPVAEPQESPSPELKEEAEAAASPQSSEDKKSDVAQFNQGPISTGQKAKAGESEAGLQTVIEMQDGSTLDVDAAWEDKQGIWYRRSGLVSFVESSRVKAITARKGVTRTPELQDR